MHGYMRKKNKTISGMETLKQKMNKNEQKN